MPNAKSIGWAIYAAGIVIWLFGYLSPGHASAFEWDVATLVVPDLTDLMMMPPPLSGTH